MVHQREARHVQGFDVGMHPLPIADGLDESKRELYAHAWIHSGLLCNPLCIQHEAFCKCKLMVVPSKPLCGLDGAGKNATCMRVVTRVASPLEHKSRPMWCSPPSLKVLPKAEVTDTGLKGPVCGALSFSRLSASEAVSA